MKFTSIHSISVLASLGLGLTSCQPDIDAPAAAAGQADFSSYIAVGNSLTAGYSDGGLYNEAQASSYPAILAKQFNKTGKGPASFVQPEFDAAHPDGSGYIQLKSTFVGTLATAPVPTQPTLANSFLGEKLAATGTLLPGNNPQLIPFTGGIPDNLGIPGISVLSSLSTAYGVANPFFERLLPAADKGTKNYVTYVGQKVAQKNPTFFTCWLGNNDVLTYATNGGVIDDLAPGFPNPLGGLTDTTTFGLGYRAMVQTLTKNGTVAGAVANIPDVTSIPYFKTVTVAAVVAKFKSLDPRLTALYIQPKTGAARAATDADLLTLTAQTYILTKLAQLGVAGTPGLSPLNPLPSKYVLDTDDIADVKARTTDINKIIAKTAAKYKVPVADMNAFFTKVAAGATISDAVTNSTTFATGNLFSLDGVHPTLRGYALVANEWIRTINGFYGSTIPSATLNDYRGVRFPQ